VSNIRHPCSTGSTHPEFTVHSSRFSRREKPSSLFSLNSSLDPSSSGSHSGVFRRPLRGIQPEVTGFWRLGAAGALLEPSCGPRGDDQGDEPPPDRSLSDPSERLIRRLAWSTWDQLQAPDRGLPGLSPESTGELVQQVLQVARTLQGLEDGGGELGCPQIGQHLSLDRAGERDPV
jgi:hypothetical protein